MTAASVSSPPAVSSSGAVATTPPLDLVLLLDAELRACAPDVPRAVWERVLIGPARDLLARPAKQFRAQLVKIGWRLAGRPHDDAPPSLIAAIELLHGGSLIVDDIQDDAEERRGDVALHRRYGMPVALNTGNWMYFVAFSLVDRAALSDATRLALLRAMVRAVIDCHAGQGLDVGQPVVEVARAELRALVERATALKTGALARLAVELGAIAAGCAPAVLAAIGTFGQELGIGLQMLDDLGSITSPARAAKAREDLGLLRPTWPWVWAREHLDDAGWQRLRHRARALAARGGDPQPLIELLAPPAIRAGRAEASARLRCALEAIRGLGAADVTAAIARELERLEASYG